MKRKGLLLFLIFILVGWVFVPAAHAFNPLPNAFEFGTIFDQKTRDNQMSKEVYTPNTQALYLDSGTCFILGCSLNPESAFYSGKSAVAAISNVVVAMYTNPPADLALWIKDTGQTLGFIPKQAYAQGVGFSGLSPLLGIWKAFRNISYALLAVVMIVIGFMVMFRKKIDPKTVITVQNALPKIVLALLLVTFSYAIAAFFIDLMYLVMAIIINLLVDASGGSLGADTTTKYLNGGFGTLSGALIGGGFSSINDVVKLLYYRDTGMAWFTIILDFVTLGGWFVTQYAFVSFIVAVIILIGIIRIAFMLISAYIQIIIAVLVAPFQLMVEAIPGSNGFSSWLKNMIANISVFPVTAALLLVGTILTRTDNDAILWTPPLLSGGGTKAVQGIIGLGMLISIPNIVRSIKEALKTKPLLAGGTGLGAAGGIAMQTASLGMSAFSMKQQKQSAEAMKAFGESVKGGLGDMQGAITKLAERLPEKV